MRRQSRYGQPSGPRVRLDESGFPDIRSDEVIARIHRSSWWAFYGPIDIAEGMVRAVIEVTGDVTHDFGSRPRPHREIYPGHEAMDNHYFGLEARLHNMTQREFDVLVKRGVIVQLAGPNRPILG